ncbi:MAG: AraC family transcriptional regulator [Pseudomonadota bacterium]
MKPRTLHKRAPLSVNYVRTLLELMAQSGLDTERLLRRVGLERDEVYGTAPTLRFEQFRRVMQGARDLSGDPAIGLRLGQQMTLTAHGLLGYAAISSANLADMLALLERYFRTRTRLCEPRLYKRKGRVHFGLVETHELGDVRVPYLEVVMASVVAGAEFILGERFRGAKVVLPYPAPEHAGRYREVLKMEVGFGGEMAELSMPEGLLHEPFPMADPGSREAAAQKCEEELERLEAEQDWALRIRNQLMRTEGSFPSLEQLAEKYCLTSRTLRRYLDALGVSYRQLLDEVREDRARRWLRNGLSVQRVADKLGYSDPSNFSRAFRQWSGVSPSQYRRQHYAER